MQKWSKWDIGIANMPFQENREITKKRPVLILGEDIAVILSFKITTHEPRYKFPGEYQIMDWKGAGLKKPSVVRCSDLIELTTPPFKFVGKLSENDIKNIQALVKKDVPKYSYLVEGIIPDDDPEFDRVIF